MNGMAIFERTDTETKALFIDQEQLEISRQNALTKRNRAEKARQQREADMQLRKAEKAEARRKAYNIATVKYLLTRFAVSGIMVAGWAAGLIHPLVSLPLTLICLCTASERLGEWRAKNRKKEENHVRQ